MIVAPFGGTDALLAVTGTGPDTLIGGALLMQASADAPESSRIRRPARRPKPVVIDGSAILDTAQARSAVGASHLSVEFVGAEVRSAEDALWIESTVDGKALATLSPPAVYGKNGGG